MGEVGLGSINRDIGLQGAGKAAALNSEGTFVLEKTLRHCIGEGDSLLGSRRRTVDVLQVAERRAAAFSDKTKIHRKVSA